MSFLTIGIHIGHDGGVAIARDNEILVACSEERLSRVKYANGWWNALRYCLESVGLSLSEIDLVVFSNAGKKLDKDFNGGLDKWSNSDVRTCTVDHHLSHCISAYAFSHFDESLVFVGDAGGNEDVTESVYWIDRGNVRLLMESSRLRPRAKGLGTTYEAFTNYLGFADQESGKTMALAAFGDPDRWQIPLFEIDAAGQVESALESPHHWGVIEFAARSYLNFELPFPKSSSQTAKDIAAYIQKQYTDTIVNLLLLLTSKHNANRLIISGGIGLNCVANSKVRQALVGVQTYFFPACNDAGLPIGNALYGQWQLNGEFFHVSSRSMLLGRRYSNSEILAALNRNPDTVPPGRLRLSEMFFYKSSDVSRESAELLNDGKIIGWWQDRSEFGPRALGARSILCNPRRVGTSTFLNEELKLREWFRPFAASILSNDSSNFVDGGGYYPYMIEAPRVTELGRRALGECVHIDQTSRLQTVDGLSHHLFVELLERIKCTTGHGAVLNTSFNIWEPIVETPGDAVATFLRSRMDALVLNDYICLKE